MVLPSLGGSSGKCSGAFTRCQPPAGKTDVWTPRVTISPAASSNVVVSVYVAFSCSALAMSTETLTTAALAFCGSSSPPAMLYSAAGAITLGARTPHGKIDTGSAIVSETCL